MNILGLSALYHESAACLLQNGRLTHAVAEERLTRVKHDPRLPVRAVRHSLQAAGLTPTDLDAIAYYEQPVFKQDRQRWAGLDPRHPALDPAGPFDHIRDRLGYDGPILTFPHHLSHAATAYFFSGFDEAAILTVDGVGEWATTTYGRAARGAITLFEEIRFPHSLGLLYATLTAYLGFRVNAGEYKVMGLAAYGRPRFRPQLDQLIHFHDDGRFTLELAFFDFVGGDRMFSDALPELLGRPPRQPEGPLDTFHQDVAASIQSLIENALLAQARHLAERVPARYLCYAGGVALNSVANGRLRREGPFDDIFIPSAPGDAGACLGAAALAHRRLTGHPIPTGRFAHDFHGPAIDPDAVAALLAATGLDFADYRGREDALLADVAGRLAANHVVGLAHGRLEFGPRALGHRSILANPADPGAQERLNRLVKRREPWRPFAPSVLAEYAADHFDLTAPAPFMLETCAVTSPLDLPAITHADGSARPQTVDAATNSRFAALLRAFHDRTGCPILLNTSLNLRGEPIAATAVDALSVFGRSEMDALVLADCLLERAALPANWPALLAQWPSRAAPVSAESDGRLYTFV